MVELRKRKTPVEPAAAPASKKKSGPAKGKAEPIEKVVSDLPAKSTNGAGKVAVGESIALDGFGGEVETHAGEKTSLKNLADDSKAGVVLFTYPKASTPGCTTQACLFRDQYSPITASGLSVYGLSTDSPKSNTTFATKQSLPYTLLCDPSATLISAIGMKKGPKGTTRGVIVVDKTGKILAWRQAGPQQTLDAVMSVLPTADTSSKPSKSLSEAEADETATSAGAGQTGQGTAEQIKVAETAAEVADSAEKLDKDVVVGPSS